MTDLTPIFTQLLETRARSHDSNSNSPSKEHGQQQAEHVVPRAHTVDEFLKEANRINAHISSLLHYLQSIRHSYLSTAPPPPPSRRRQRTEYIPSPSTSLPTSSSESHLTDTDRDTIDSSTASLLRDLSASIANLASAESLRRETVERVLDKRGRKSRIMKWASGGDIAAGGKSGEEEEEETRRVVRDAVLWCLRRGLEGVAGVQRGMVERRIERVREREKSVLYKFKNEGEKVRDRDEVSMSMSGSTPTPVDTDALDEDEVAAIEAQLTPEQLQLFAQENDGMLKHYEDTLSKVQNAEKSLLEISSLQQTLVTHLATQEDFITQLVTDASNTQTNVTQGNKELQRASERRSTAQMVFWGTVGLCAWLVVWDAVF